VLSSRVRRWSWGLGISAVTAVTAFGVAGWQANAAPPSPGTPGAAVEQPRVSDPQPVAEAATGTGSDPLTTAEVAKARAVALTPQLIAGAKDVTGAAGPEYLSAEPAADGTGRRADLYFYDYKSDKLVKQVVDLGTGKLAGSYAATGLQQPAARREIDTALDLVLAGPYAAELRQRFAQTTGRTLTGPADLQVTAHVHRVRPADTVARSCGAHRCLRLVVQAADGQFIDLDDLIIDLSGRTVARLK
jgi:hypothetical protein